MKIGNQLHRSCANCSDESELVIEWDAGGRLYLCRRCLQELIITSMKSIPHETVTEFADRCRECGAKYGKLLKQKSGEWIPVSERLPNLDDYTGSKLWQNNVLITGYLSFDDTKESFVSEAFAQDVIYNLVHDTVVTAWMPLPEPYKTESEEEE